ncbi:MAG: hypothetical protein ABGW90_13730 [Martelella sp.]
MSMNFNLPNLTFFSVSLPIGARVRYYPVAGQPEFEEATIRSEPWVLGHGAVVIAITGRAGGVSVEHIERVDEP